ncbi:MAG: hypothetical protein E7I68_11275, partial [Neisseria sp.]|nr:hypothetical protein [Neisseria sp.]
MFRRNESGGWDKQTWVYRYDALNRRIGKGRLKDELHPKSWTPSPQLTRCSFFMSKYTLHFKYQAVL